MSLFAEDRIALVRVASSVDLVGRALEWFREETAGRRGLLLRELGMMVAQAGCVPGDLVPEMAPYGIRTTWTPAVLMSRGRPKLQIAKVLALPEHERERSLLVLLSMYRIADQRRRSKHCGDGCNHWWHRPLEDRDVRRSIIDSGDAGVSESAGESNSVAHSRLR